MTFLEHAQPGPIAYDKERANDVRALYPRLPVKVTDLLAGTAGCSPYLRGLLERHVNWLKEAMALDCATVLPSVRSLSDGSIGPQLRVIKARTALWIALCDLGALWPLERVTQELTDFADWAVECALNDALKAEVRRGKLPESVLEDHAGVAILAMGKMGAGELNYSSDIDLIVVFDETLHEPDDFHEVRSSLIRATKLMAKTLSEVTSDGYVFRTDLRLRPDPSVTPVCLSMEAAERYYESVGRTWERAAFIKARICAGNIKAGKAFLDRLTPFVWRKHLDFAAIQDAHDMRLRIRDHKGLARAISVPGHNMKLGAGGIREIEFFAQTRQLIAGGRDASLRCIRTVEALDALATKEWISKDVARDLSAAYRAHRTLEHRIQMISDAQTHDMPSSVEGRERLAAFCGWDAVSDFEADILQRLKSVQKITEEFFAAEKEDDISPVNPEIEKILEGWAQVPALRSPRAMEIFKRLKPHIAARLDTAVDPSAALAQLDTFVRGLPAGVQLFSLMDANPHILDLLIDICGLSPSLAAYLPRNTSVLDGVLTGRFFEPIPDVETLREGLRDSLNGVEDYEDQLNAIRRWHKELHFRIGVLQLRGIAGVEEAAAAYSALAQATLHETLPCVLRDFERRYGAIPNGRLAVLSMGKLASDEMTATSDLDMIVIYDGAADAVSNGKRGLAIGTYYARLTQAFLTSLTSPMAEGRLYEVDMRLRPSGRSGPVATSLASFASYQHDQAWTWEHLALTRAQALIGDAELCQEIDDIRSEILARPRNEVATKADVLDMRTRIAKDKARTDAWDVKGRAGGLLDIELFAQLTVLLGKNAACHPRIQLQEAMADGTVSQSEGKALLQTHRLLGQVQHMSRLLIGDDFSDELLTGGLTQVLLTSTGYPSIEDLKQAMALAMQQAAGIIERNLAVMGRN